MLTRKGSVLNLLIQLGLEKTALIHKTVWLIKLVNTLVVNALIMRKFLSIALFRKEIKNGLMNWVSLNHTGKLLKTHAMWQPDGKNVGVKPTNIMIGSVNILKLKSM
jgi:hypothetical protein